MEKRSTVKHEEVGNIEDKIFVIFDIFLEQSKRKENVWLLTNNGSTNYANLLVIVASHVSLVITSPWFKSVSKHDPYITFTFKLHKTSASYT